MLHHKERQKLQTAEGISGGGALGTGFQGVAPGVEENEKLNINLKMWYKAVMGIEKMIIFESWI